MNDRNMFYCLQKQVESSGVYITKTLTDVLWYLDPHIDKFNARCIYLGDNVIEFRGYNDWRHQKRKEPTVRNVILNYIDLMLDISVL